MLEQLLEAAPRFFSYYNVLFLLQALLATFLLSLVGCVLGFLLGFVLAVTRRTSGWRMAPLRGIVMREGIEPLGSLKALRDTLRERVARKQA